jgi:hypothetical protein
LQVLDAAGLTENLPAVERGRMNQNTAITHQKPSPNGSAAAITTSLMIIVMAASRGYGICPGAEQ